MNLKRRKRKTPVADVMKELYLFSGNRCAFPGCDELLVQEDGHRNFEIAHIHGVSLEAARGVHDLTDEELRSPSNLLLLCPNHHNKIDNKDLESEYPVEVVENFKRDHEKRFREAFYGMVDVVDETLSASPIWPRNLQATEEAGSFYSDSERQERVRLITPFLERLATVPSALRSVLVLILTHGRPGAVVMNDRVEAYFEDLLAAASNITEHDLDLRLQSLERWGFLNYEKDDGPHYVVLIEPDPLESGADGYFKDIYDLAENRRTRASTARGNLPHPTEDRITFIRQILMDLDFSLLDVGSEEVDK